MIALNTLKNNPGAKKERVRTGRGIGSGLGKTGGVGGKGQKGRAGIKRVRGVARGQTSYIKKIPKRGFNSRNPVKYHEVNLQDLENLVSQGSLKAGQEVDADLLIAHNLVRNNKLPVKLLAKGKISTPLIIKLIHYSQAAQIAIINAGGQFKE